MNSPVQSILNVGSGGIIIDAECHLSNGLPSIIVVGLGGKAVDEAKERVRSAFASSNISLPRKRITINLAPADIPKESTSLDLVIAASILQASGQLQKEFNTKQAVIGELGLDGRTRPVRGIVGKLMAGKQKGLTTFFIPAANLEQALLVPDICIIPLEHLQELYLGLNAQRKLKKVETGIGIAPPLAPNLYINRLEEVVGQARAKRAVEIAAAGGHNLFLSGPPGTGKSMLAKALPSILPPLTQEEMLEITHLHSLTGNSYEQLVTQRPFRAPHHSASHVSIVGGGHHLRPGEITLSHRGVLFLDELPEFSRVTIEALRQPLEDRTITVARAKDSLTYPANFILVGTANPCPCGYYGSNKSCECTAAQIIHYRQKMSGPILDRIDLYVEVEDIDHRALLSHQPANNSDEVIRSRILAAREVQRKRFKSAMLNTDMTNSDIKSLARLDEAAHEILNQAANRLKISARAYMRAIKVARTIADLANSPTIQVNHLTEALQYRSHPTNLQ